MWNLEHVTATNFISFKKLELDITQGVCTLLFGENLDNENQKNNGSGKSTIVEAIAFGITGESLKKASSINDIINDYEEEAYISVTFNNTATNTTFVVERQISRSGAQQIICRKTDSEGMEIETERTTQPSVNDYNRFILEELGITKEQLYSCYLLNNARFKSFFVATDKEKKEIINNFSNGVLVDQALDVLANDIEPIAQKLSDARIITAKAESGLNAINEQINNANNTKEQARKTREEKIEQLQKWIGEKRRTIRELEESIDNANDRLDVLEDTEKDLRKIIKDNTDIKSSYEKIATLLGKARLPEIKNYRTKIEENRQNQHYLLESINDVNKQLELLNKVAQTLKSVYEKSSDVYNSTKENVEKNILIVQNDKGEIVKAIDTLSEQIQDCRDKVSLNQSKYNSLGVKISAIKAQIGGAITCPKCKHKFLLDSTATLEDLQKSLASIEKDRQLITNEINNAQKNCDESIEKCNQKRKVIDDYDAEIENLKKNLFSASDQLRESKKKYIESTDKVEELNTEYDRLCKKAERLKEESASMKKNMFDEALENVAKYIGIGNRFLDDTDTKINSLEEVIVTYQQSIKSLENTTDGDIMDKLLDSQREYQQALECAKLHEAEIKSEYDNLLTQQDYFVRFKSHLANTKIDAIANEVNNFLEKIGSDLHVELSGYKVLKSKKVREKITIEVFRDGSSIGSLEKLSGGEKNRIMLAGILAMQHLTNINCEDDKGLSLLVIDEVLEASDYSGLMSYTDALNALGVTTILVTQNGVSEQYTHQLLVRKEGGISTII